MKKFICLLLIALVGIGGLAWAQGVRRLATFGTGTQVTGIGAPCTVSCFFLLTSGTVTLNGATPVTVAAANVTANSVIVFTIKTAAGTVSANAPNVLTITPGTGFTVGGTALDTSLYSYLIIN